jgi:pimeloyl-ACP methyl ester carboxylesterase
VPRSAPVDGFRLAYDRLGSGPPVVLLHGWPGDRGDHRRLAPLLAGAADVVVPDLRGFGESDKHPADPGEAYSAAAQARSVLGLMDELGLDAAVLAGYDVGSRVSRTVAAAAPERVRALVLSPPMPGAGERVLTADAQREFWYQGFHRLGLAEALVDGDPARVRAYLRHFWSHWSADGWEPPADELDRLVAAYSAPGAFAASINWYRAGAGAIARSLAETAPANEERIAPPTLVVWGDQEPLFPLEWADRIGEFFADATLEVLPGIGHFTPLEAPDAVADGVRRMLARTSG